ncbi:uncharacterized protein PHALS_02048 [Plasmopara halstedii]|uniref:Uncharacterized protein n=1 Tax=Plasmopara halstedii TaxID=4781 RepID=A0A0P1ATZ9_PLAHL|nr:uncharacterized protein PHALS_02048 [Plasmopara halstedii]CEG45775.1 hypothetical protein PHALS_02048 [Plasmopara halstedii]|eukprot:XP_024582144.1 hypothetical protein PHALS_02048 [Plasmopara halstedii]
MAPGDNIIEHLLKLDNICMRLADFDDGAQDDGPLVIFLAFYRLEVSVTRVKLRDHCGGFAGHRSNNRRDDHRGCRRGGNSLCGFTGRSLNAATLVKSVTSAQGSRK